MITKMCIDEFTRYGRYQSQSGSAYSHRLLADNDQLGV